MISFFEIWISLKYLFPKTKEKFFSVITLFSFLGISLGVATLIIVMSVMNGFREELTSKILGINGHLKIKSSFGNGLKNDTEFSNSTVNDTLTLTNIVNEENKVINNRDLDIIKNELIELKSAIYDNKDLLEKILLKIK